MAIRIIYFTSLGCTICTNQTAILDELKSELSIKVDCHLITTAFDKALMYGVKSAPAMVFLYEEKPQVIKTGFQSKNQVKEIIEIITGNLT